MIDQVALVSQILIQTNSTAECLPIVVKATTILKYTLIASIILIPLVIGAEQILFRWATLPKRKYWIITGRNYILRGFAIITILLLLIYPSLWFTIPSQCF